MIPSPSLMRLSTNPRDHLLLLLESPLFFLGKDHLQNDLEKKNQCLDVQAHSVVLSCISITFISYLNFLIRILSQILNKNTDVKRSIFLLHSNQRFVISQSFYWNIPKCVSKFQLKWYVPNSTSLQPNSQNTGGPQALPNTRENGTGKFDMERSISLDCS